MQLKGWPFEPFVVDDVSPCNGDEGGGGGFPG